jgi:hypothetical protein
MNEQNTYARLVAKVENLDYILGPSMYLDVKNLSLHNSTVLEDMCQCERKLRPNSESIDTKTINTSFFVDLLYQLEKLTYLELEKKGHQISYCKSLKGDRTIILSDNDDKKYIFLTDAGKKIFEEIWYSYHDESSLLLRNKMESLNRVKNRVSEEDSANRAA